MSVLGLLVFLYEVGFRELAAGEEVLLHNFYHGFFLVVLVSLILRMFLLLKKGVRRPSLIFEGILLAFMVLALVVRFFLDNSLTRTHSLLHFFDSDHLVYLIIFYVFLVELSKKTLLFYRSALNPAQLFVLSFLFLIALGTGLLLLPQATYQSISFIDALFIATSAVCVTGLVSVDPATVFTPTGQAIVLLLIQVGGLGIMTFASFFGIFFQGSSIKSALFMKDWLSEDNLGQITRTLFKIIAFTLVVEAIGAFLVFLCLQDLPATAIPEKVSFSIFHAISAFCNAGFSTLSLGLYDPIIRQNYSLQLVIALLIIFGGLGFPIVFNTFRYLRYHLNRIYSRVLFKKKLDHKARLLNINTLLVLITTAVLLVVGTVLYFLLEKENTLAEHSLYGKVVGAFFGAVTPRTAGFNTVNLAALSAPTILLYLLLMWIGASPASVGGGIKTSTFAIAILNIISLAKGKDRVEVFRRELPQESIHKAFAVILLSLLVIGLAVFLVTLFDPQLELTAVAFESFSAFATVGLTVGITSLLSVPSKVVIICAMFLGRVGTLTLLVGLLQKVKTLRYRYPKETIIIT
ncbi:ATPase [Nibribacter ruber]|uniref:ATPase n=2 Tax=Nibribacter ruber TaxID=2698458 RepID=A0A6P1P4I5_9BACT|nr:ATPase [Nibribacter ruber]